jgi:hypothetical protein
LPFVRPVRIPKIILRIYPLALRSAPEKSLAVAE